MKPTLDENGRLVPREDYRLATLNCGAKIDNSGENVQIHEEKIVGNGA